MKRRLHWIGLEDGKTSPQNVPIQYFQQDNSLALSFSLLHKHNT